MSDRCPAELHEQNQLVQHHRRILDELSMLYSQKNKAYGNSFHNTFVEEGYAMARIRLSDKLNRFKTLTQQKDIPTGNESIRDTLLDLANYSIMTIIEMEDM